MPKPPVAVPKTEGRIYGTDWSIANVVKLLRSHAGRGAWSLSDTTGGYAEKVNRNYLRQISARHLPTGVSLILARLEPDKRWYCSLCFADDHGYLPWNGETAELWLNALFGEDRARLLEESDEHSLYRNYTLPV